EIDLPASRCDFEAKAGKLIVPEVGILRGGTDCLDGPFRNASCSQGRVSLPLPSKHIVSTLEGNCKNEPETLGMRFVESERFWRLPEAPGIVDPEIPNLRVAGSNPAGVTNFESAVRQRPGALARFPPSPLLPQQTQTRTESCAGVRVWLILH